MTQHTPGPWTLHEGNTAVNGADGHLVASCGFLPYRNKWDSEDNARLIAAAPELLGTLECATACLESTLKVLTGGAKEMIEMQIAQGHEAIAKARGE